METKINERLLDERLEALEKARSWSPRVISKLEGLIRSGDDLSLFRINPVQFGTEKNIPEQEVIDLFLYGAKFGLFQMNWHLLCPGCSDVVESFSTLRTVNSLYHCNLCQIDREAALDDYIEVSFTITPTIREIVFHNPEGLSVEDYFFKYLFRQGAMYPDGIKVVDAMKGNIKLVTYLEPNEKKEFELEIPSPGFLVGLDRLNRAELFFKVEGEPQAEIKPFSFKIFDRKFEPGHGELSPGKFVFAFENSTNKRGALLLIHAPSNSSNQPPFFQPFLSGKKLITTQTFRDLFGSETIQGTEGIGVRDIAILFTDLKGSTALYDRIGDLKAFSLVRQHFGSLSRAVSNHSGAIVKTIGDAIMATFLNPLDAVKAALGMLEEIERLNQELQGKLIILKIGIHKGASVAVTLNERLDYFGQTVNIASRVQGLADSEEVYITHDVYTYPGVQELLKGFKIVPRKAKLRGVQEEMQVYKITHKPKKPKTVAIR